MDDWLFSGDRASKSSKWRWKQGAQTSHPTDLLKFVMASVVIWRAVSLAACLLHDGGHLSRQARTPVLLNTAVLAALDALGSRLWNCSQGKLSGLDMTYVWRLLGWAGVGRSAPCKACLAHGCCLCLLPALEISCSVSLAPHMPVPGAHFIAAAVSLAYFCQHRGLSQKWRLKIIHLMQSSWTSETWIIFTTPEDTEKPTSSLVSLAESRH